MIKAIIFDHDGVIIDNQPFQKQAWQEVFKEYGINISDKDISLKIRGRPTLVGLKNFFGDKFNDKKLQEIAKRKEDIYKEIFKKNFTIVKGIIKFLKEIKKAGLPIAIATSSTKEMLNFTFKLLKIRNYFNATVTSDKITKSKPDPEIYLLAAKKLGVQPKNCVVFEDSFSGIESAKRAGMKTVLVMTTHQKNEFEKVDLAINDFTEIFLPRLINL